MPLEIRPRDKFACAAVENAGVAQDVHGQIELAPGLWLLDELPFEVGEFWAEQLGQARLSNLQESNLLLFAIAPSEHPDILDAENDVLLQRVQRMFFGLLMQLVFHHDGVEIFTGAQVDDEPNIRQVTDWRKHLRPNIARVSTISRAQLKRAATAEAGIGAYLTRTGGADRLWHGFHALQRGFLEYWGDERLHQFVRSVEAVLNLRAGQSRNLFGHRAQLFVGRSDENRDWLLELYDLRSATEHMNDYHPVLDRYPERRRDHVANLRAYEAQALASHIYLRLAESQALRTAFGDDDQLQQFWDMREGQQQQTWGPSFNLRAYCAANSLPGPLAP